MMVNNGGSENCQGAFTGFRARAELVMYFTPESFIPKIFLEFRKTDS